MKRLVGVVSIGDLTRTAVSSRKRQETYETSLKLHRPKWHKGGPHEIDITGED
jgi:hypothetical protein